MESLGRCVVRTLLRRFAMSRARLSVLWGTVVVAGCVGADGGVAEQQPQEDPRFPLGDLPPPAPPPGGGSDGPERSTPKGPQPDFGPTVRLADPPPPISGGTLLVTRDFTTAYAADPDRDEIYIVDLGTKKVTTVPLTLHDEPGRLVEDDAGHVHVALRRGGAIVTVDATGALLGRRAACPAPRGIAWDAGNARLLLACEGGELVALDPAADGPVTQLAQIDRDLRDVVVSGSTIYVSRFRNAEILRIDPTGAILERSRPAPAPSAGGHVPEPTLGWRMVDSKVDGAPPIIMHEVATNGHVNPAPTGGGYGSPGSDPGTCPTPESTITSGAIWDGINELDLPVSAVLPVDVATDGVRHVFIGAGNGHTWSLPQVFKRSRFERCISNEIRYEINGQVTAVALLPAEGILVQSRQPAMLVELPSGHTISLSAKDREDTGHAIFHSNSGSGIACASCHGEGGDDAHVWPFDNLGDRRTPSLRGTIQGTAPYHWSGEMVDISHLLDDVLSGRMNGPNLLPAQKAALESWVDALPGPIPPSGVDAAAAARGKALFESDRTQCANCHSGPKFTNSATVDVGTGGAFQVPSLVGVSARTPLLHSGCAATLEDRFGVCATSRHGKTSGLAPSEIADLVAYLKTL
jgi:mono/diheme cytochrome c family protein